MKSLRPLLLISAAAVLASACGAHRPRKSSTDEQAAAGKHGAEAQGNLPPDVNVEEASLRGKEFQNVEDLKAIYFDYDSATLKDAQLQTLKANAEYLKAHPSLEALVAGFCDERGTIEYNLALGQKRAKEVREYYIRLGVPGKSVATISYGKENPSCAESTEQCWAQNRRAETRVRAPGGAGRSAEDGQ